MINVVTIFQKTSNLERTVNGESVQVAHVSNGKPVIEVCTATKLLPVETKLGLLIHFTNTPILIHILPDPSIVCIIKKELVPNTSVM